MINFMKVKEILEKLTTEFPICEYAFGNPKDILFSDKIFQICQRDCERYGHSWVCPPNAGDIGENIQRVRSYDRYMVFSTLAEADAWNKDSCLAVKKNHEEISRAFRKRLFQEAGLLMESREENPMPEIYVLSAGCTICENCTYPDSPCRHPKEKLMTIESHGILIMPMLEKIGITYQFDSTTIAYFTMILFHEK